ncbi:MAG: dual specificity protein phosphatase family protein [Deltaproteobacteria bacterium]|nr:dual specificity protein phosphatase family protein [Deltaproteobacteria bacterium]
MLDLDIINDRLIVGSRPEDLNDVEQLRRLGITGVLSLQSDGDLNRTGLSWAALWRLQVERGMEVHRYSITDFNPQDLIEKLEGAVDQLEELAGRHERVYVHCTAGVNRSPTVSIAWLFMRQGRTLDQAMDEVTRRRTVAQPYPQVIRWLRKLEKQAPKA